MFLIVQADGSKVELIVALESVDNPHSMIFDVFFEVITQRLDTEVYTLWFFYCMHTLMIVCDHINMHVFKK